MRARGAAHYAGWLLASVLALAIHGLIAAIGILLDRWLAVGAASAGAAVALFGVVRNSSRLAGVWRRS